MGCLRRYGLSGGRPPDTRPYIPKKSKTSPTTRLNSTLDRRNARGFHEVLIRPRWTNPESRNKPPNAMAEVEETVPPHSAAAISSTAATMEMTDRDRKSTRLNSSHVKISY